MVVNSYATNIRAPKYIKQKLTELEGEINRNIIIAGDFNTPLSIIDTSFKQTINKKTALLMLKQI